MSYWEEKHSAPEQKPLTPEQQFEKSYWKAQEEDDEEVFDDYSLEDKYLDEDEEEEEE